MSSLYLHPKQHEVFSDKTRFKVVAAGRRWGKCSRKGTNIKTSSGIDVKIEDLKVGDSILSMNPNTLLLESKTVTAVASNGKKEILKVSTAFRSFRCTPNHPIMVGWDWVEARDIKPKDLIGVAKRDVFGNDKMPSYEVDFLSVWLADGDSNGYTKPDPTIIEIMNNVAKSLNIEFVDCHTEKSEKTKPKVKWRWRIVDKKRKNEAIEFLKKQDVYGLTSKTKFIPDKIFKLNKEQLARFIGLFYACDGSVSIRTKDTWAIELQLANERMVRQFSSLLLKFGIRGQIRNKIHKAKSSVTGESFESWRLIISDSEMIVKFAEQIEIPSKQDKLNLAKAASLKSRGSCNTYLPISHDEFIQHLSYTPKFFDAKSIGGANAKVARDLPDDLRLSLNSWRKQTPERVSRYRFETIKEYSDGYFNKAIDGDIAWEEVISVEHDGYEETYDIEVEDNHSFIAEGLISHNSRLSQVSLIYKATEKTANSVWYIAPSYRMAKQIMWDEINRMIPTKWVKKRNETFMRIDLLNNSIIELKGADAPESLRGVGLNYVVLDEMQDMRPEVWKSVIRPTLATTRGEALFIGCVNENTMVLTEGGARSINHFSKGSPEKTLDDINLSVYGIDKSFHTADGFWNNGVVPTVKITSFKGLELESSLSHPILVMDNNGNQCWKKTENLKLGDRIAIDRDMNVWGDIDPGKGFSFEAKGSGFKPKSHLGEIKMTDDLAYLMGLWLAEGSFEKNGRVAITCGDDVEKSLTTGEIYGLKFIEQRKNSNCSTWRVSSQHLLRYMEYIGMPMCKATDKTVPQWVFNGKRSWAESFVAGMFDGDGHVLKSGKKVGYTTSSKQMVLRLQLLLLNLGIMSGYCFVKGRENLSPNALVKKTGDSYQLEIFGTNIGKFRDCIPLRVKRKKDLLDLADVPKWTIKDGVPNQQGNVRAILNACPDKNKIERLKNANIWVSSVLYKNADMCYRSLEEFLRLYEPFSDMPEYQIMKRHLDNRYFWDFVDNLESNSSLTYDFTIPDTHSFWSNGFISHNTSKGMDHFHDLWARGMSGTSPYWKSWQFTTESSPFVPKEEIKQAKRDMDPKTYRQEFLASFEEISGRVYHSFDKRLHVGQYRFNPNLPICIGQDFNIDPMSSVVFQPQPNGEVWAVDEIILFSSNTQEVCEEIERRYWRNLKQITIYPDPAGGARQHARGETDLDIFREKGFTRIKYHRKHPRVADRVNSVNKMLLSADGTVRLRVDEKCKHLIDSFERTMYKEGGREVDKSMSVEHACDAAGYYLEFEFPARRIETLGISI